MNIGFDPVWFIGIVELIDELAVGRCKVRAFGFHGPRPEIPFNPNVDGVSQNQGTISRGGTDIPNPGIDKNDLPWASILQSGASQGIIEVGEWVFGCFLDGRDAQHPVVMGIIPGQNNGLPGEVAGGNGYTNAAHAAENFGSSSMHPAITGEGGRGNAQNLIAASRETYQTGGRQGLVTSPPYTHAAHDAMTRVMSSQNKLNSFITNNDDIVIQSGKSQIQIDSGGNVTIYAPSSSIEFVGAAIKNATKGAISQSAGSKYTVHVSEGGVQFDTQGDFEINCASFKVNARDRAHVQAGAALDFRGARVHVNARADNIDMWAKGKLRLYSGGISTWEVGGFEGLYITTKRVNWFNYFDFKLSSLAAININTPGLLDLKGSITNVTGYGYAGFKSTGVTDIFGPVINMDLFVNMGTGASTPPLPPTPLDVALHIGLPLGPILSEHFATVPKLPPMDGVAIKMSVTDIPSVTASGPGISSAMEDSVEPSTGSGIDGILSGGIDGIINEGIDRITGSIGSRAISGLVDNLEDILDFKFL